MEVKQMMASRAGSLIDDAIALMGFALMIGSAYYLYTRIELGIILSNKKKAYIIFSIVIGFLLILAGTNKIVKLLYAHNRDRLIG